MIPIKMTFTSGEHLTIYSEDPNSFAQSISEAQTPDILNLEYTAEEHEDRTDLEEVKLTLKSGAIILCNMSKGDLPKAQYIQEIVDCDTSNIIAYGKLAKEEADLDARFASASMVINNIPNLDTRLHLHRAYMKRKQAYVSSVEALIDGCMRRPNE